MATVEKIMHKNVPVLKKEAKISEAAKILARHDKDCIIVVENGAPIGFLTELDILNNIVSKKSSGSVKTIMSKPVTTIDKDTPINIALKTIDTKTFGRYPIVDDGKLLGFVTKRDVITHISDELLFHRRIQNFVIVLFLVFEVFLIFYFRYLHHNLSF